MTLDDYIYEKKWIILVSLTVFMVSSLCDLPQTQNGAQWKVLVNTERDLFIP
jgi:hypothetical protein